VDSWQDISRQLNQQAWVHLLYFSSSDKGTFLPEVNRGDIGFDEAWVYGAHSDRGGDRTWPLLDPDKTTLLIAGWMIDLQLPGWIIIILILLVYQVGGSFIEDAAFFILATRSFFLL